MSEVRFMISEAAKQVRVESHVLRYWEEELDLKIGRTEMGHRYYTKDDIQLFCCMKKLKDEGLLLKDLKPLISDLRNTRIRLLEAEKRRRDTTPNTADANSSLVPSVKAVRAVPEWPSRAAAYENIVPTQVSADSKNVSVRNTNTEHTPSSPDTQVTPRTDSDTTLRISETEVIPATQLEQVRSLIGDVLEKIVTNNNETLKKGICEAVTKDIICEMDFLFQAKERREEEHYRKLDCLIRQQQANRRAAVQDNPLGRLKRLLT